MLARIDKFAQESGSMAKRKRKTRQKSNIIDRWFDKLLNIITPKSNEIIKKRREPQPLSYDELVNGDLNNQGQKGYLQNDEFDKLDDVTLVNSLPIDNLNKIEESFPVSNKPSHRDRELNSQKPKRRSTKRRRRSSNESSGFSKSINNTFDRIFGQLLGDDQKEITKEAKSELATGNSNNNSILPADEDLMDWVAPEEISLEQKPLAKKRQPNPKKRTHKPRIKERSIRRKAKAKPKKGNIWKYLPYEWRRGWETFLFNIYLRSMPHDPWLENRESGDEAKSVFILKELEYVFSSFMTFVFAGLSAWLIYQLSVILTASFFGISSVLYYFEVMFPVGNSSPLWTQHSIIMITLSGPLMSLIIGLITFFYVIKKKKTRGLNRLFFMWLSFHLFNQFFGSFVAGVITDQGFGYVANWLYMGIILKFAFSVLALFVMAFAGYKVMPYLLTTAGKPERLKLDNRISFVITQAVLPCLIGTAILLLLRLPNKTPQHQEIFLYDSITSGALIILVLGMFFNLRAKIASVNHRVSNYKVSLLWLAGLLVLILAVRLGLANGLLIVFRIVLHISSFN